MLGRVRRVHAAGAWKGFAELEMLIAKERCHEPNGWMSVEPCAGDWARSGADTAGRSTAFEGLSGSWCISCSHIPCCHICWKHITHADFCPAGQVSHLVPRTFAALLSLFCFLEEETRLGGQEAGRDLHWVTQPVSGRIRAHPWASKGHASSSWLQQLHLPPSKHCANTGGPVCTVLRATKLVIPILHIETWCSESC